MLTIFSEQDFEKRAPITVKFEIPYFTVSGIQVRYLKIVEKSGYQALPWVRYITQNGDDYRSDSAFPAGRNVLTSISFTVYGQRWRRGAPRSCRCRASCFHFPIRYPLYSLFFGL